MMSTWSLHTDTTPPQPNHNVTPTHIEPDTTHVVTQRTSRKLLRMDVLTSETCWALNKVIIKQVASSWSLFTQQCHSGFLFLCYGYVTISSISTIYYFLSPSIIAICPRTFSNRVWRSLLMACRKYIQWCISYIKLSHINWVWFLTHEIF